MHVSMYSHKQICESMKTKIFGEEKVLYLPCRWCFQPVSVFVYYIPSEAAQTIQTMELFGNCAEFKIKGVGGGKHDNRNVLTLFYGKTENSTSATL